MKFNKFIWKTFKESNTGKEVLGIFSNLKKLYESNKADGILSIINEFRLEKYKKELFVNDINFALNITNMIDELFKSKIRSDKDAYELFREIWDVVPYDEKDKEKPKPLLSIDDIECVSVALFFIEPQYFFPYFFRTHFFILQKIFNDFGIYLPPIPGKSDIENRINYYWELCKSLTNFCNEYGIAKHELPTFLYGFAVNVIDQYTLNAKLSSPQKAFFIGGGKNNNGDFEYLDKSDKDTIYFWQGNIDTQPGDIIVMYCLAPRSYIHSIWRAVTPGFIDPFFHYYGSIYIGKPIMIKQININEIKKEILLSEMPLVKGNMQGINGRLIQKRYYDRILEILKEKGQNLSELPKLKNETIETLIINNERDVEIHLLEPLLIRLGYSSTEWKRQLKIRMGRGERLYPDYVIFPNEERNNESGYWIWEAKYSIANHKQLKEDFGQAKSYALRLKCKGLGLASTEGIWISVYDFNFEKLKYWSWNQLRERDYFTEIYDLTGNKRKI